RGGRRCRSARRDLGTRGGRRPRAIDGRRRRRVAPGTARARGGSSRRARRRDDVRRRDARGGDPVRVAVADATMLTREGIVRLLRDADVEVVAQAENADELLRHVELARPDAAIVDIRMPPTHTDEGLVAAQRIRAEHPQTGVLVLSQYVEPSYALRLLE